MNAPDREMMLPKVSWHFECGDFFGLGKNKWIGNVMETGPNM